MRRNTVLNTTSKQVKIFTLELDSHRRKARSRKDNTLDNTCLCVKSAQMANQSSDIMQHLQNRPTRDNC